MMPSARAAAAKDSYRISEGCSAVAVAPREMALAPRGAAADVRWCTKTVKGSEAAAACCRKRIAVSKGLAA
eukprot:7113427-Alexandrium_andersonii.AAC.1